MISPVAFVPPSRKGLIPRRAEHLLRQACAEAASWPNRLRIAVNISPLQMEHDWLRARSERIPPGLGGLPFGGGPQLREQGLPFPARPRGTLLGGVHKRT